MKTCQNMCSDAQIWDTNLRGEEEEESEEEEEEEESQTQE